LIHNKGEVNTGIEAENSPTEGWAAAKELDCNRKKLTPPMRGQQDEKEPKRRDTTEDREKN